MALGVVGEQQRSVGTRSTVTFETCTLRSCRRSLDDSDGGAGARGHIDVGSAEDEGRQDEPQDDA